MTRVTAPLPLSDDHPDELLTRTITPPVQATTEIPLEEVYEIERTIRLLKQGGFRQIALQFPDDLLHDAAEVSRRLQQGVEGAKRYILADTSYGSCCVDEVAAEHINADVVVHYGRACLSPVTRLPVIYVFGRRTIDIDALARQFQSTFEDKSQHFLLMCDTSYAHSLSPIYDRLTSLGYTNLTQHPIPDTKNVIRPHTPSSTTSLLPPTDPLPDTTLILISTPSNSTTTLLTYHHLCHAIYTFSPATSRLSPSSPSTNLALRRRYVAVQKARDAGTVGIIVGTLGKGGYLELISMLRRMILEAGKKPYLLALGKLNPAKVANFAECDVFCVVACPESTVIDSRDYYKPIITPYELYLALTAPSDGAPLWGADWISDFERVMSLSTPLNNDINEEDDDTPHFSLVTGKLVYSSTSRPMRLTNPKTQIAYDDDNTNSDHRNSALVKSETQVALREDGTVAVRGVRSLAGETLMNRGWRGLKPEEQEGQENGAKVETGRDGVARGYRAANGERA